MVVPCRIIHRNHASVSIFAGRTTSELWAATNKANYFAYQRSLAVGPVPIELRLLPATYDLSPSALNLVFRVYSGIVVSGGWTDLSTQGSDATATVIKVDPAAASRLRIELFGQGAHEFSMLRVDASGRAPADAVYCPAGASISYSGGAGMDGATP